MVGSRPTEKSSGGRNVDARPARRVTPERRSCAAEGARPSCRRSASRGAGRDVGGYRVLAALRPQGGGTASGLVPSSRRGPRCASSVSRRRPGRHLVLTGHGARCTWRRTLDAAPRTLDGGQSPRPYCPRMGVPHQLTLGDRRDGGARGRGPRTRPRACGGARTHHRVGRRPVVRIGLRASRWRSIRSEGHMLNPQRQLDKQLEAHQPGVRKQGAGGPHRAKCHPLVTLRSPP